MDVFQYRSYKLFLSEYIEKNKERGLQASLADAAGCKAPYFSRVLREEVHLTPEHAIALSQHLGFDRDQCDYFVCLVDHERAGTTQLRLYLKRRLEELQKRRSKLENRFNSQQVQEKAQQQYYSSWVYTAIHILTSIPEYQSVEAMALRLNLPPGTIRNALQFLLGHGLVAQQNGRWTITNKDLHISEDSPLHTTNIQNWQQRALVASQQKQGLHYVGIHSLSQDDCNLIRNNISELLQKTRDKIQGSPEEEGMCLAVHWFPY